MDANFKLGASPLPGLQAPAYPIFHLESQGELFQHVADIYARLGTIEGIMDTILADMVGEVTFLASVEELTAAIATVDATVATTGAATTAAIESLAATTAASSESIVVAITEQGGILRNELGYQHDLDRASIFENTKLIREAYGYQSDVTRDQYIKPIFNRLGDMSTILTSGNTILTNIHSALTTGLTTVNSKLTSILTNTQSCINRIDNTNIMLSGLVQGLIPGKFKEWLEGIHSFLNTFYTNAMTMVTPSPTLAVNVKTFV